MSKILNFFCSCGLEEGSFQLVLFIPRELGRHLWKKQAVLRWKKEVSQHWYNHCTELCLPRTSKSLPYHFCTWSRTQLWLPGELLRRATSLLGEKEFIRPVHFVPSSFNLWFFFSLLPALSTTLDLSAPRENPRAKTRRRRAIISCMQELHRETSSTTISSPSVACATSARCWRRREATVLSVCFFCFCFHLTCKFKPHYSDSALPVVMSVGNFNPIALISELIQATRDAPTYWLVLALKSNLGISPVLFLLSIWHIVEFWFFFFLLFASVTLNTTVKTVVKQIHFLKITQWLNHWHA